MLLLRRAAPFLGGLAATIAAAWLLPRDLHPGLRATLWGLPLAAALFATLRQTVGGKRTGRWSPAERVLWPAWILAALLEPQLGLRAAAPRYLFGGFVLLVAWRLRSHLPALRRQVARGSTRPLALAAFAAGFAVLPWVDAVAVPAGDEPYYLLLAESVASDHDFDLRDEYRGDVWRRIAPRPLAPQPGDPLGPAGQIYSRHESLFPVFLAPFWAAGGTLGVRLALMFVWALLSERLYRAAIAWSVPGRGAFRAWLAASFLLPLLLFAHTVWLEVLAALAVAIALEALARRPEVAPRQSARSALTTALALLLLPLLKLRFLLLAGPLALQALFRRAVAPRLRALALLGVGAAAGFAMLWNWSRVGRLLRVYDLSRWIADDLPTLANLPRIAGLFFDSAFGLAGGAPFWFLAIPGAALLLRRRREALWAFAAFVPYLLLVTSIREWYGGWCPPFRFGIVLLPLLTAALAAELARPPRPIERFFHAALFGAGAAFALAALIEPRWSLSFADGRTQLLDLATAPFRADFARLLPSMIRPRLATWLFPAVALALVLLARRAAPGATRHAWNPAAAALLLASAAAIVAAHELPTRVAELEDPWVYKGGGTLEPDRWMPDRTRFTGGWRLFGAQAASLRPIPGGDRVVVAARFRAAPGSTGGTTLELASGDRRLGAWRVAPGDSWRVEKLAPVDWRPGDELELRVDADPPGGRAAVDVDRLEFTWH